MRLFFASVILLFALLPASAETSPSSPATDPQALLEAATSKAGHGAAVAAIVTPAGTRFYAAGQLSPDHPTPPTADTVFEIGSITKGFTGLLVAQMELAGEVSPADTLAQRLTDWPQRATAPSGTITLLQLATHSSGLPRLPANLNAWLPNPYASYDAAKLHRWLDIVEPARAADGTVTPLYSNVGAAILGHTLSVTAGKPYEALLRERILAPLALNDTSIPLSADQRARLAPGFAGKKPAENWDFDVLAPAGALRSTANDLVRFARQALALDANPLAPVFAHATRDLAAGPEELGPRHRIGYAWIRTPTKQGQLIWHNGGTGGYRSQLGWIPDAQLAVIVLSANARFDTDALFSALINAELTKRTPPAP